MRIYENSPMKEFRGSFEQFKKSQKQPENISSDRKIVKEK